MGLERTDAWSHIPDMRAYIFFFSLLNTFDVIRTGWIMYVFLEEGGGKQNLVYAYASWYGCWLCYLTCLCVWGRHLSTVWYSRGSAHKGMGASVFFFFFNYPSFATRPERFRLYSSLRILFFFFFFIRSKWGVEERWICSMFSGVTWSLNIWILIRG